MANTDGVIDDLLLRPKPAEETQSPTRVYSETILHLAAKANRCYSLLQSNTRLFVETASSKPVVRFADSRLADLLRMKVAAWDESDELGRDWPSGPTYALLGTSAAANLLFSWSSGDKYIAARKLELEKKKDDAADAKPPVLPQKFRPTQSFSQRLNLVVEKESNRFIQDRISVIKAHHTKQASRKVDARKKKDHEMHLRRLRMKEDEYERELQAAIALQTSSRHNGFFSSLFGIHKPMSSSFTLDILDDLLSHTPVSSRSSMDDAAAVEAKSSKRFSLFPFRPKSPRPSGTASDALTPASPKKDNEAFAQLDKMVDSLEPKTPTEANADSPRQFLALPLATSASTDLLSL